MEDDRFTMMNEPLNELHPAETGISFASALWVRYTASWRILRALTQHVPHVRTSRVCLYLARRFVGFGCEICYGSVNRPIGLYKLKYAVKCQNSPMTEIKIESK